MGKRSGRERRENETGVESSGLGGGAAWLPIVLAAGALVLGFFAWTEARQSKADLNRRLGEIDQRVLALQNDVAKAAKAAPPQQQGPDPNKVYPVKLEGSPYKGNPTAPIVIAEFSDYQ
jgi:protein-disulfide isomerase